MSNYDDTQRAADHALVLTLVQDVSRLVTRFDQTIPIIRTVAITALVLSVATFLMLLVVVVLVAVQ